MFGELGALRRGSSAGRVPARFKRGGGEVDAGGMNRKHLWSKDDRPATLRQRLKEGLCALRAHAGKTIAFWRDLRVVQRRRYYEKYGYDDFYAYCAEELGLRTPRYINECLPIGTLSEKRFEGCSLTVDVLLLVATLEPLAQQALAEIARGRLDLKTADLMRALAFLGDLPEDQKRAAQLRAWFVDGQAIGPLVVASAAAPPPAPPPPLRDGNRLLGLLVNNLERWLVLVPELQARLGEGDKLAPGPLSRVRALLVGHPQLLLLIWGAGAASYWGVGAPNGTFLHHDGNRDLTWTDATPMLPVALRDKGFTGVSGSGPQDVWAAGDGGVVAHFDGAAWSAIPGGPLTKDYKGVFLVESGSVWIVGNDGALVRYQP